MFTNTLHPYINDFLVYDFKHLWQLEMIKFSEANSHVSLESKSSISAFWRSYLHDQEMTTWTFNTKLMHIVAWENFVTFFHQFKIILVL